LIEASGGAMFPLESEHTGCDGARFANGVKDFVFPDVTMPLSGSGDVSIWGAFMQVRDAAILTQVFELKGEYHLGYDLVL